MTGAEKEASGQAIESHSVQGSVQDQLQLVG